MTEIPFWEKSNLTIAEAAKYFSIGENKLRELVSNPRCTFIVRVGNKTLIRKHKFDEYLDKNIEL